MTIGEGYSSSGGWNRPAAEAGPPPSNLPAPPPPPSAIAERIAKAGRADALPSFRETEPVSATKEAFYEVLREAREVHDKKGADYGKKHDSFANVRAAEDFGLPAWLGAAIECNNKIHRIQSFYINGRLENEGIEDAFRDMLVYAGIGLCLYREGK